MKTTIFGKDRQTKYHNIILKMPFKITRSTKRHDNMKKHNARAHNIRWPKKKKKLDFRE